MPTSNERKMLSSNEALKELIKKDFNNTEIKQKYPAPFMCNVYVATNHTYYETN